MIDYSKQDFISRISQTEDEKLLLLLQADYDYFTKCEQQDVTDILSGEDKEEVKQPANEPSGTDTINDCVPQ